MHQTSIVVMMNLATLLCVTFLPSVFTTILPFDNSQQHVQRKVVEFRSLVRGKVYPEHSQVHSYIQDDLYIFRWLENANFVVARAVQYFMEHLAWRRAHNINTIDSEEWADISEEYPQFYNTTDKLGRPIAELWLSVWDIRRAALSGQVKKLVRWTTLAMEETQRRLYEIRRTNKNVTGAVQLVDAEGFNARQNACGTCLGFFLAVGHISEEQYPYLSENVIIVNVGSIFRQISTTLSKHLGSRKVARPRIYSTRRGEWLPVLDSEIDRNQRSVRFGGNLTRS